MSCDNFFIFKNEIYCCAPNYLGVQSLRDFSQSIKITNSEVSNRNVATRTDYTIASCAGAETKLLAYRSEVLGRGGTWLDVRNLISDNRSCRRHKPTWASEGTRTRRASLHVQRASCGKRINLRKGRARMGNALPDLSADSSRCRIFR